MDKLRYFRDIKRQLEDRDKSIVTDMFQGIVGDCITCKKCRKPKYKFETELMISLPLNNVTSSQSNDLSTDKYSAAAPSSFGFSLTRRNVTLSKNVIAFDDCLQRFFELEHLPITEKLNCDYCKSKQQVTKQTEICSLPQILIVHFKRFYFDEMKMDYDKIDDTVEIK